MSIDVKSSRLLLLYSLFILCLLFEPSESLYSQTIPEQFRQVTTHAEKDLAPRLSPDGKWLAFVSKRSGNYDLWLRNMETGRTRQLTTHRADDYYPAWDPKSSYLVFVSQRSDAEGDVFKLELRNILGELVAKKDPEQLTFYKGFDGYPCVSPDGKQIAWVTDRTGLDNIWLQSKGRNKNVRQLTHGGATHPIWSPIQDYLAFTTFRQDKSNGDIWLLNLYAPEGAYVPKTPLDSLERPMWPVTHGPANDGFPVFSPDAKQISFIRHDLDTDKNGKITPDDAAAIWSVNISWIPEDTSENIDPVLELYVESFNPEIAHKTQIVTQGYNTIQPEWGTDERIYCTSPQSGNPDIWSLPDSGFFPTFETPAAQLQYADEHFPLPNNLTFHSIELFYDSDSLTEREKLSLWNRIQAFQNVCSKFENAELCHFALLQQSICYHILDHTDRAQHIIQFVENHAQVEEPLSTKASIVATIMQTTSGHESLNNLLVELQKFEQTESPEAAALVHLIMGDVYIKTGDNEKAISQYTRVVEQYPGVQDLSAESYYKRGLLHKKNGDSEKAIRDFSSVLDTFDEIEKWSRLSQKALFEIFEQNVSTRQNYVEKYENIADNYSQNPSVSAEALYRKAQIFRENDDYQKALSTFEQIENKFGEQQDYTFKAALGRADILFSIGQNNTAFSILDSLYTFYLKQNSDLAVRAQERMVQALLRAGDELRASGDYELAIPSYRHAWQMAPENLRAHRGYIQCHYRLGRIDDAIHEYDAMVKQAPDNNIIKYAQGLAYSYKGTEKADLKNNPYGIKPDYLKKSNDAIRQALSQDYTLIDAYLTMSYNYETLETHHIREQHRPKSFLRKSWNTVTAPLLWTYRTLTFWSETREPRYYEDAIQELSRAMALNDAKQNPELEARLALNMANNYYKLGEFGFKRAYEYYHISLRHDSTFTEIQQEATIKSRMGHCALVVQDLDKGPGYLKRSIQLYKKLDRDIQVLINIKRLALLYEIGGESKKALQYYQEAADIERRRSFYTGLMRSYRSMAHHSQRLNRKKEALYYSEKALELLNSDLVRHTKSKPIYLQFGLVGLYFPIPYDLRNFGAKSTIELTTAQEEAFVYNVLANSYLSDKTYDKALKFLNKKWKIYKERKDADSQAIIYNNIGYINYLKGDYYQAWLGFTNSYWKCYKIHYISGQALNIRNSAEIVLAMAKATDPYNRRNLKKCHDWITDKIREVMELIEPEKELYYDTFTHFHMLLAQLALIDPVNNKSNELHGNILSSLTSFDNSEAALVQLDSAMTLSRLYKQKTEECAIEFHYGRIYHLIGNEREALRHLLNSRNIAIRERYLDMLWQINTLIGETLEDTEENTREEFVKNKTALDFYGEAIDVLQTRFFKTPGLSIQTLREAHEEPYRKAIAFMIEQGDTVRALKTAEEMRSETFLNMVTREIFHFASEKDSIFYEQARKLKTEINESEIHLLQLDQNPNILQARVNNLTVELDAKKQKYKELVQKINTEAPGLEPLIHVPDANISQIQTQIPSNRGLFYHIALDDFTAVWIITNDNIRLFKLPIYKQEFTNTLLAFEHQLSQDSVRITAAPSLMNHLFTPLQTAHFEYVTVIPDYDVLFFPWHIINFSSFAENIPRIERINSSLLSYSFANQSRKIEGQKIATTVPINIWQRENYMILDPDSLVSDRESVVKKISNTANIFHLKGVTNWDHMSPLRTTFAFPTLKDSVRNLPAITLYEHSANPYISLLDFTTDSLYYNGSEPAIALERSFFYSGVPSVIFSSWPKADSAANIFYKEFYKNLQNMPPAMALHNTQKTLSGKGVPASVWGRFQFYGFPGMTKAEEQEFASENIDFVLQRAEEAFNRGDWQNALQFYRQAADLSERRDSENRHNLQDKMLQSAVNGAMWSEAIDIQNQIIRLAESAQNWQAAARGYKQLANYYGENNQYDKAAKANQEYDQLTRRYGLERNEGSLFIETAQIYERGHRYEKAIEWYLKAADVFHQQEEIEKEIKSLRFVGDLYATNLNNLPKALEYYTKAKSGLESDETPTAIDISLKIASVYAKMGLLSTAQKVTKKTLFKAQNISDSLRIAHSQLQLAWIFVGDRDTQNALDLQKSAEYYYLNNQEYKALIDAYKCRSYIDLLYKDYQSAIDHAFTSLEMVNNQNLENHQGELLHFIGVMQWLQGNQQAALTNLRQAVSEDSLIGNYPQMGRSMLSLASFSWQRGKKPRAQRYITHVLSLQDQFLDAELQATARYLSSLVARQENAIELVESAQQTAQKLFVTEIEWRALAQHAALAHQQGNLSQAVQYYEQSLQKIEDLPNSTPDPLFLSLEKKTHDVYTNYLHFLIQNNQSEKALVIADRAEQQRFLEKININKIPVSQPLDTLFYKLDSLRETRLLAQHKLALMHNESDNIENVDNLELQNQLQKSTKSESLVVVQIQKTDNRKAQLLHPKAVNVDDLQSLLPRNTAVLCFYHNNQNINSWLLSDSDLTYKNAEFEIDLDIHINKFVGSLRNRKKTVNYKLLYELFWEPWENNFDQYKHIVILPFGKLQALPMHVLKRENEKPIGLLYNLSAVSSLTQLEMALQNSTRRQESNSEVTTINYWTAKDTSASAVYTNLLVKSLERYFATVHNFRDREKPASAMAFDQSFPAHLLFGCPVHNDTINVLNSALQYSSGQDSLEKLVVKNILAENFPTRHVSIYGLYPDDNPHPIMVKESGLIHSFIFSGTSSVFFTRFGDNALSSSVLIKRFFRSLSEGYNQTESLRRAREIVYTMIDSHPSAWGNAMLFGDFR